MASIIELAESEGIFTTAQAARIGIPRDALHDACESGRLERIARGAYRLMGSGSNETDELIALWKLTAPKLFAHERMAHWDGVCVGGSSAAYLNGMGNLHLSPYRMFSPRRINSRSASAHFSVRDINRLDVAFEQGLPVTKPERTIFDLVLDHEDPSLIADALRDSGALGHDFDFTRLQKMLAEKYGEARGERVFRTLQADSGLSEGEA